MLNNVYIFVFWTRTLSCSPVSEYQSMEDTALQYYNFVYQNATNNLVM